jgi:peptidoglycan/xylan/chitin deacetylase (PgdA/CDA1 family)
MRRRALALGVAVGLVLVVVALARGDAGSPFGHALDATLSPAQAAKLPWRQRYTSGSAGPLDGRGFPSPASQRAAVARFYRLGLPIYCAGSRGNYAALTFDDGPAPLSGQFVSLLQRAGAPSTHFIVGSQVGGDTVAVIRQEEAQGGLADHTWTHPFLTRLSQGDLESELSRTKQTLEEVVRGPITLMRPPYGDYDPRVNRTVHRMGMIGVLWDVDTRDSAGAGSDQIVANATDGLRPGAIILMHETYDRSLAALPQILSAARKKGIGLVSVPQLLALDPPPDSLVKAGPDACSDRERYQQQDDATAMRLSG